MNKIKIILTLFFVLLGVKASAQDVMKIFPGNTEVPNWTKSGEARTFVGDKLWEYIDGGAENYYLYGFKKVVTMDYKNQKKQLVVDIYEMRDPKNTFGIYSYERASKYNFVKVGVQGYQEGTTLTFWKGNYYVKVIAYDKSAETKSALMTFGKAIEKKISGNFTEPAFLSNFPKSNLIANSQKYFAKDILGHSFLYNGFISEYKEGSDKIRIFLIDAGNVKSAQNFYTAYKNYVTGAKSFEKEIKNVGNGCFSGKESSKKLFVFYNAKLMGGIIGISDEAKATKIMQEIVKK